MTTTLRSCIGRALPSAGVLASLCLAPMALAQESRPDDESDVIVLSPFEVSAAREDGGYTAETTLAGNRLNTKLRDIGNAVTVITPQLLADIGATNNASLLQYTPNTEVGGIRGNFAGVGDGAVLDESSHFGNPNNNTRVRGLSAADNTRDFFLTDIPWDGYNIDGIDLQRGPNSILFGQGRPAGIINARTAGATFGKNSTKITARYGSEDSTRTTIDANRILLPGELSLRIAGLYDQMNYQQEPAFSRQKRIYGATRWEPKLLKQGSARTIVRANLEAGEVRSNMPRQLPPYDQLTPWFNQGAYTGYRANGTEKTFQGTNQATYTFAQFADRFGRTPNGGPIDEVRAGAGLPYSGENAAFNPWLGAWRFENPTLNFNGTSSVPINGLLWEPKGDFGLAPDGSIDRTVGGLPFARASSIASYSTFATNARLPYYNWGVYKDKTLVDPSVFNFYDRLIDGDNKREWTDFRVYNLNVAQTFLDDRIGVEATYNRENVTRGQSGIIGSPRLMVDIMSTYPDGSANPNVGRPFIYGMGGNNRQSVSERESTRVTAFATHDFNRNREPSVLTRLLGRHTVTGLRAEDEYNVDQRSWQRYGSDAAFVASLNRPAGSSELKFNTNTLTPTTVIYLGNSLVGRNGAAGANIPNPTAIATITPGASLRVFDSTWNAPASVNPADVWTDTTITGTPAHPVVSTQSENPANYVGWTNKPYNVIDADQQPGNREALTTSAELRRQKVSSKAFVWQGHFWDEAIVGTWGVRQDISKSWGVTRNINSPSSDPTSGRLNLNPNSFRLPDAYDNRLKVTSHAWTVVAHLNQMPFLDELMRNLPVNVSLFYNDSSNFEALSQRVNFLNEAIAPPSGKTIDQGIRVETKDGRWSLRVNKYETTVTNGSSTALSGAYNIGNEIALATMWARRFEHQLLGYTLANRPAGDPYAHPSAGSFRYGPGPGQTQADADAIMHSHIASFNNWIKTVDPRFFEAWGYDPFDLNTQPVSNTPLGFAVTEDSVSEGYEIEIGAQPTPSWRVAINASQTEARRNNIGGAALTEFMNSYQDLMNNGPAGDLRIWWGASNAQTAEVRWNSAIGSEWAQRKLQEGTAVPELREWRVNVISNYAFNEGRLKGFNVGGAVRYESEVAIGYRPIAGSTPTELNFDIANPYMGPAETNFDFWVGYQRRLTPKLNWRIQFNMRNAFTDEELIPITVQPDGSPAAYRIAPSRAWEITNTFEF